MVVILVLLTILTFLTVDYFVERSALRRAEAAAGPRRPRAPARVQPPPALPELAAIPAGLFVGPGHVWLELERGGGVRLGTDAFAPALLGSLDQVETVPVGGEVRRGERLALLRRGERAVEVRSPVDGLVAGVNRDLACAPGRLASDPYGEGWLVRVLPRGLGVALGGLAVGEEARDWLRREASRLRDRLVALAAGPAPALATAPDGGLPVEGVAALLDENSWRELEASVFAVPA
jgi:glycine cleavage system H protein